MNQYAADLHIHTVLSPCATDGMTPQAIVREAIAIKLSIIAICDHNSARNVYAVQKAAGRNLCVLAGMELTTAEEAHIVAIFSDVFDAEAAGEEVRKALPELARKSERPLSQAILSATDTVTGRETRQLSAPSAFKLTEALELIRRYKGIAIAAHVDRHSFSVISQYGRFPADAGFSAVEVSARGVAEKQIERYAKFGVPVVTSSDSHHLKEIGRTFTVFNLDRPTFHELVLGLRGEEGRTCEHI